MFMIVKELIIQICKNDIPWSLTFSIPWQPRTPIQSLFPLILPPRWELKSPTIMRTSIMEVLSIAYSKWQKKMLFLSLCTTMSWCICNITVRCLYATDFHFLTLIFLAHWPANLTLSLMTLELIGFHSKPPTYWINFFTASTQTTFKLPHYLIKNRCSSIRLLHLYKFLDTTKQIIVK